MLEAYFDESGTHQGSPVLCVAGYVFEKDNARKLSAEWAHMLEEYGLKYFHMKECAPCRENFSHLNMDQCDAVARHAYGLIKQYMTVGYAVTVATNYFHLIPNFGLFSSPYTFGCWQVLMAIRNWSNTVGFFGKISYFFEAGHPSQAESDSIMAALVRNLYLEKAYRYDSHSFVGKRMADGSPSLVQCADVLAWHSFVNQKKRAENKPSRKDYISLIENNSHLCNHYGEAEIKALAESLRIAESEKNLAPHDWSIVSFK